MSQSFLKLIVIRLYKNKDIQAKTQDMKLIIFEGTDRVGKNTQIYKCAENFNNVSIKHWIGPPKTMSSLYDMIHHQKLIFTEEFMYWQGEVNNKRSRLESIVWNRSHIGEWVYGSLYRNYEPHWIYDLEDTFGFGNHNDIYLINFWGDPEFIIQWEDGLSSAQTVEQKRVEIGLFKEAVEISRIKNKLNIKVNDGNKWRAREEISSEINNFIFNK